MQNAVCHSHEGRNGKIIPECGHEIIGRTEGFRLFLNYYITTA